MKVTLMKPSVALYRSGILGMVMLVGLTAATALRAEEPADWINLLPDNKLETHWTTTGNWKIDDQGVVALVPRPGESGWTRYDAYLWLKKEYTNFVCEFEYKLEPKGNSGFYFHASDLKNPVAHGVEVQIYDSHGQDRLTDHTSGGVIPGVPPKKNTAKPAGEWNKFVITVQGNSLKVVLNGETVNEVDLSEGRLGERPKRGAIGFQDHGLPLWLRNIRIRPL